MKDSERGDAASWCGNAACKSARVKMVKKRTHVGKGDFGRDGRNFDNNRYDTCDNGRNVSENESSMPRR